MKIKKKLKRVLLIVMSLFMTIVSISGSDFVKAQNSLDDWNITLNWGDPKEGLPDNWKPQYSNDDTISVKTQLTIQYRGDGTQIYKANDIQISMNDIADILDTKLAREGWGLCPDISSWIEISSSADKKGFNGDEDWEYTTTGDYDNHQIVFTNKNEISSSFTSTIQVVLKFNKYSEVKAIRLFKPDYSKNIQAILNVNGLTKESNIINYSFDGVQDQYQIKWYTMQNITEASEILSKIPQEQWKDYYYFYTNIQGVITRNTFSLKNGWRLEFNYPDDFVLGNLKSSNDNKSHSIFTKGVGEDELNSNNFYGTAFHYYQYGTYSYLSRYIAIPKEYLNRNNGYIDLNVKMYGTYTNEDEEKLISSDTTRINLNDAHLSFEGDLYATSKDSFFNNENIPYTNIMRKYFNQDKESLNYENEQGFILRATSVYYGKKYNLILGDDLQYFVYDDNSSRRLENNERVVNRLNLIKPGKKRMYSYEVYAKRLNGSGNYEKIKSGSLSSNLRLTFDDWYYDIKVKYLNLEETLDNVRAVDIYYKILDNENLDQSKSLSQLYNFSYMQIENINENGKAELVDMNYNIDGSVEMMMQDIEEYSKENYGSTVLRGMTNLFVKSQYVRVFSENESYTLGYDNEGLYKKDTVSKCYINNYSLGNIDLKNFKIKLTLPDYLTLSDVKFYIKDQFYTIEKLKEKGIEVDYKENHFNNGKYEVIYSVDSSKAPIKLKEEVVKNDINIQYDVHLSYDNYIMYGLSSKNCSIQHELYDVVLEDADSYENIENIDYFSKRSNSFSIPNVALGSFQGIQKEVRTSSHSYTKQQAITNPGEDYSYKLKISSGQTKMAHIVLYDNLENVDSTSWKGFFQGLDMSVLERFGIDVSKFRIYYSLNRDQMRDLTADGWILSTEWNDSLNDVKSIAIDMQGYVLNTNQIGYIEVLMKAPESDVKLGSVTKNQYFSSYKEYDEKDESLSNPLKETKDLPSNITLLSFGKVIPTKELTIIKTIYKEDVNFAYGNPVSLFKIEGDDIEGNHIVKFISAEFTEDFVNNTVGIQENGLTRIDMSQKVILPLGEYTVSEIENLRYKLIDIDTVNEKSKTWNTVTFDLESVDDASVRFTNRCTNFNDLSHSDIVVNEIKKGN